MTFVDERAARRVYAARGRITAAKLKYQRMPMGDGDGKRA